MKFSVFGTYRTVGNVVFLSTEPVTSHTIQYGSAQHSVVL